MEYVDLFHTPVEPSRIEKLLPHSRPSSFILVDREIPQEWYGSPILVRLGSRQQEAQILLKELNFHLLARILPYLPGLQGYVCLVQLSWRGKVKTLTQCDAQEVPATSATELILPCSTLPPFFPEDISVQMVANVLGVLSEPLGRLIAIKTSTDGTALSAIML